MKFGDVFAGETSRSLEKYDQPGVDDIAGPVPQRPDRDPLWRREIFTELFGEIEGRRTGEPINGDTSPSGAAGTREDRIAVTWHRTLSPAEPSSELIGDQPGQDPARYEVLNTINLRRIQPMPLRGRQGVECPNNRESGNAECH